jgi:hypothetical protein
MTEPKPHSAPGSLVVLESNANRRAIVAQHEDVYSVAKGREYAEMRAVLIPFPGKRGPAAAERARLQLGNPWRRLVLPTRIDRWSLTGLQQRLVKTGGHLVKHARYYWLLLAESHLTRRLFGAMLQRIWTLPVPTG